MTRRYDRAGDALEVDDVHRCAFGWLGEDSEGRPDPCPTCRPHLVACTYCARSPAACRAIPGRCCGGCSHHPRERTGR
jgi:hypothetical protein